MKNNKRVELRPASRQDLIDFYGEPPAFTMRAIVAVLDHKPIGVAGVVVTQECAAIFSDLSDDMRAYKKSILKGAFAIMNMARELHMPICATGFEATSPALLKRLGFESLGEGVYACPN
jgi:hypothetical protein